MNSYVFIFSFACVYRNICILASICVCIRMHRRRLSLLYIFDGAFSRRLLKQFRLCFNHIIQPLWRRTFHTKFGRLHTINHMVPSQVRSGQEATGAEQSATKTTRARASSACAVCGTNEKGRLSCCAPGGSWHNNCGAGRDYSWAEGFEVCKRQRSCARLQRFVCVVLLSF